MALRTIPEKISEFLRQRPERMYCDTCIQERLGLKWRQQVQLITATLAVTETFKREYNTCCTCNAVKSVTHAVEGPPTGAGNAQRSGPNRPAHKSAPANARRPVGGKSSHATAPYGQRPTLRMQQAKDQSSSSI